MNGQLQQAELLVALKDLLVVTEQYKMWIDREWGACRTIKELKVDGFLPPAILVARALLTKAETCIPAGDSGITITNKAPATTTLDPLWSRVEQLETTVGDLKARVEHLERTINDLRLSICGIEDESASVQWLGKTFKPGAIEAAFEKLAKRVAEIEQVLDESGKCHVCGTQYRENSEQANYVNTHGMCIDCMYSRPQCKNCSHRVDSKDELTNGLCHDCREDTLPPERPGSRAHERRRET